MCQFNLLIIDKEWDGEHLKKLLIDNGFGFRKLNNKSLQSQIGNSRKIILTTKGHCDCGSILGLNHQNSKIEAEKEKKKLRKKKWSESKIERYLSDKLKEQNKREEAGDLGNETEENNWIRISQILRNRKTQFGILFRQFGGLIEDEVIEIEKTNQVPIELLSKGEMRNFKENQLNWITK